MLLANAIDYFIPDVPRKLREHCRREAYLANEIILKTELEIARGGSEQLTEEQLRNIRQRVRGPLLHSLSMPEKGNAPTGPTGGPEGESKV